MKIAFVSQPIDAVLPPNQNSIGIIIYEIGRRLAHHCSVVIYMRGEGICKKVQTAEQIQFRHIPIAPDRRILRVLGRLSRLFSPRRPMFASKWYYLGYILQIAHDIRRQQCDVVHVVNFSQFVPIIRVFNPNVKIVLHMECEWLTQLDRSIVDRRLRHVNLVVGCSEYITNKIRDCLPKIGKLCHTVYNGVDTDHFCPLYGKGKSAGRKGHGRILFIGRISPEKGLHVLLRAFESTLNSFPGAHLQLLGPQKSAPSEYIVSLTDDQRVLALAPLYESGYVSSKKYFTLLSRETPSHVLGNVNFSGTVPYSDLVKEYSGSDLFVFPSVWNEPFGMPIIEAMACGLPVVATRGGGIPEIVQNGETGILVERGDSSMLAEAILRLLEDERLRESMGDAGRKRVLDKFTWDGIAEKFFSLYGTVLQDQR